MVGDSAHAHVEGGQASGLAAGLLHPVTGADHVVAMVAVVAVGLWGAVLGPPAIWVLPVAFLLPNSVQGPVGQVLHEVVALLWCLVRLHRCGAFIQSGIPLIGFTADEAIEMIEAAAARRPGVKRSDWAALPHRYFMALAELRGGVAIQPQCLGQRGHAVRQH
jgi:hypothetical protein